MASPQEEPPFFRIGPQHPASPVLLSVPHAGREYSDALLRAARVPVGTLETLEDRLVDRLVWRAVQAGTPAFVARVPRAEIDLNRDEREIDPAMIAPSPPAHQVLQSARTRGGLGLIPSRVSGSGAIWLHRIKGDELARRIAEVHRPYHEALERALAETRARFGFAILLDCHSMPPRDRSAAGSDANIVLGDRHGTSIAPEYLDVAVRTAKALGYRVSCNAPYAGGHIVTRHGRPQAGIHALQLEIDRSAYLDAALREPGPGFDKAAQLIASVAGALAARALDSGLQIAAE